MSRKKMICMIALVGGALGAYQHAQAQQKLVAFGDSFSDTGLVWRALAEGTGENLPVSPPYFEGRFSNGPVAVEHMAAQLGMTLDSRAWGGAMTGERNFLGASRPILAGTGVQEQVRRYLAEQTGQGLGADTLHVIWAGANDLIFGPDEATAVQASSQIIQALDHLYEAGARQFLVPLMPDLSLAPLLASDPADGDNAHHLASVAFNARLEQDVKAAQLEYADAHIVYFDTMGYLQDWLAGAEGMALDQVQPCVGGNFITVRTVCAQPDQHVYWDSTHFSAVVHERLGHGFASAIPEPSRLALMGWGLAGVSLMWRRTRRLVGAVHAPS